MRAGEIDLSRYSHVWLPDDDLLLDPQDIPRLFDLAEHFGFVVCQPARDPLGRVSHPHTAVDRTRGEMRLVNFVEMTCPLFRRESLEEFMQAFDGSLSGWGLDLWFGHVLGAGIPGRFGVIDAVTVFNPHERQKPGGFREIAALKADSERKQEYLQAAERHGIRQPGRFRALGALPLPEGWRAANPPHPAPPRVPRPSDLSLCEADRAVLAAALTPAPSAALPWGVDGITAALLAAGTGLVVAAEESQIWLRSCRHDPPLAQAFADRRLLAVQHAPRQAAARGLAAPVASHAAAAAAALAQRRAWPDLVVAPDAFVTPLLAALETAFHGTRRRPMPRILATSCGRSAAAPGSAARHLLAAGERLRLLAPGTALAAPPSLQPAASPGSTPSA